MKDVSSLYPKKMLENKSSINKQDIDKLLELRKTSCNHLPFILLSSWGSTLGDKDE